MPDSRESRNCHSALRELVRLKDIKERIEHLESIVRNPRAMPQADVEEARALKVEYSAAKDKAWQAARDALTRSERGAKE